MIMACPKCGGPMRINGNMWQCDPCAVLMPRAFESTGPVLNFVEVSESANLRTS
jgi:ribosomal protein L37AE/L43A